MQKIMIHGYSGKMGQMVEQVIKNDGTFEVVAGIGNKNDLSVHYDTYFDINSCEKVVDVVIDFSNADAMDGLIDYVNKRRMPLVICTTGHTDEMIAKIKECSKNTPILMSSNMSLGINTINVLLKQISNSLYNQNFDIEILEKHHRGKVDAPSGTALLLANTIKSALEDKVEYTFDRTKSMNKREKKELGISVIRGGTIPGEHSVIFAGNDEIIEIKHTALSRKIFADGALEAVKFILTKQNGLYSMEDVIANKAGFN
ncbi:MAG TPA: 4-hydroxy-tetrahydrodipicolinate reductase [Clostridiales bacterium]|nr:MAG: 4-hydroxy-tetrahydrodipicolinate reductase [Clostridiales bacterium GWD2_32_59]HAN10351.1 4-hydroxy-tetrahydrodipicolinate reductase [Clostridiales bacterium]